MLIDRVAIVEAGRSYLGVKWAHQGRSRERGIDCVGLLICIARDLAFCAPDFDVTGYSRLPAKGWLESALQKYLGPPSRGPGDVVLMAFSGEPTHVGIMTPTGFLHCYSKSPRRCIEHPLDDYWRSHIRATFAFKDLWQS